MGIMPYLSEGVYLYATKPPPIFIKTGRCSAKQAIQPFPNLMKSKHDIGEKVLT